ncbi:MAG: efflux RND transporter periplasmic adaptor subunit [Niabella sp.]
MQQIFKTTMLFALVLLMACGDGGKKKGALGDKKAQLEKLKAEQKNINDKISSLEDEIAKLDPSAAKAKLVTITPVTNEAFRHYIDLQGKIDAKNTAYVAPKGQGGVVRAIYVKKGDHVRKGQVILKLDDAIASQQLVAARQQTGALRTQLELAKTTHDRLKSLWANNIGTEMQVLQAKASVDALVSQLNAAEAQARMAQEQLSYTSVTADISGVIDQVNVRVGEIFAATAGPQITIVNTSVLKLLVDVPEPYIEKVKTGTPLIVTLPESNNKVINTTAAVVSKLIDPASRSFYVEANVPNDPSIRANQIAKVQIQDYAHNDAVTIPVNTLQNDQHGKFVLVAVDENKKLVARKKRVVTGELYGDKIEVKSGISEGDQLITEGFQSLYDGQAITKTGAANK